MDVAEQLCYIPCSFCNIILAVSVPCNSLFDVVTVRCGHCAHLWTVNMAAAFHSLQQQQQPSYQDLQVSSYTTSSEYRVDLGSSSRWNPRMQMQPPSFINKPDPRLVTRPPEKRQRVPSAYNQFIKEEIQRIKANNPDITHREAFSTAAKNLKIPKSRRILYFKSCLIFSNERLQCLNLLQWAHFPHIHFGLMLESNNKAKVNEGSDKHQMRRAAAVLNK